MADERPRRAATRKARFARKQARTASPRANPRANPRAKARAEAKDEARATDTRPRRRRAAVRSALLAMVLVGLLFAFVYPTRTFLDQRDQTNKERTQLEVLQSENAKLASEAKLLSSDAEIERLARERYGLVRPGEKAFVIVPEPTTSTTTTTVPPTPSTVRGNP